MRSTPVAKPAALLLLLLFAPLAALAQPCPSSSIEFMPPGPDPVFSTLASRSLLSAWGAGAGNARYDLVAGTIGANSYGDPQGGFGTHVRASDRYVLLGPSGSPPLAFSARLYVSGTAEGRNDGYLPTDVGSVTVSAALIEVGAAQDSAALTAGPGQLLPFKPTLVIPLTKALGVPFDLVMALHTQGGFSNGLLDAKLSFILPPGYAVASCQDFQGSGSTPAVKKSWGGVKLLYR